MIKICGSFRRSFVVIALTVLAVGVLEAPALAVPKPSNAIHPAKVAYAEAGFGAGSAPRVVRNGTQTSSIAPSITDYTYNGGPTALYMAYVANDGSDDILVTSSTNGGSTWSSPTNTEQKTKMTPAIGEDVADNTLVIAYVADNSNNHLLYTTSTNGVDWSASERLGGQSSKRAPSVTGWPGGNSLNLVVAFVANNSSNDLMLITGTNTSGGGITWSAQSQVGGQETKSAPSISTFNTNAPVNDPSYVIAYVANNSSNDLLVTTSTSGQATDWSASIQVDGQASKAAPTVCEIITADSDTNVMAYVANNSSNDLLVTTSTNAKATDWSASISVDGQSSQAAPGVPDFLSTQDVPMVYLANSSDDHLLITTSDNGGATWSGSSKVKNMPR